LAVGRWSLVALLGLLLPLWLPSAPPVHAQDAQLRGEDLRAQVGFDQHLDAQIPLELTFRD
jgi:hypothetical protein